MPGHLQGFRMLVELEGYIGPSLGVVQWAFQVLACDWAQWHTDCRFDPRGVCEVSLEAWGGFQRDPEAAGAGSHPWLCRGRNIASWRRVGSILSGDRRGSWHHCVVSPCSLRSGSLYWVNVCPHCGREGAPRVFPGCSDINFGHEEVR